MGEPYRPTNPLALRFPLSAETQRLLEGVRDKSIAARPAMFTDTMVRRILCGAKTQTSRLVDSPQWIVEPGSLLWLREAWAPKLHQGGVHAHPRDPEQDAPHWIWYRADMTCRSPLGPEWGDDSVTAPNRWKSAMLMPRWATRVLLRVTHDPQVMRLGDFGCAEVAAEGCPVPAHDPAGSASWHDVWTRLHGSYNEDERVRVYRFEVLR